MLRSKMPQELKDTRIIDIVDQDNVIHIDVQRKTGSMYRLTLGPKLDYGPELKAVLVVDCWLLPRDSDKEER